MNNIATEKEARETMLEIGGIRKGSEIGKGRYQKFIWHACVDCGKQRWVAFQKGKPKNLRCHGCANKLHLIGHPLRGEDSPSWRGGRITVAGGYIAVKLQPDNFFYPMTNKRGYVMEHRLVMAKQLKRCLLPWEIVHHRNEVKDDNPPQNLELLPIGYKHTSLTVMSNYIKKVEARVANLEEGLRDYHTIIRVLIWRINELEGSKNEAIGR